MASFREQRRPAPDADDLLECTTCNRHFQGKTARRKFASWPEDCQPAHDAPACSLKLVRRAGR